MAKARCRRMLVWTIVLGLAIGSPIRNNRPVFAQEEAPSPRPDSTASPPLPIPFTAPVPANCDRPLPINLATALQLANSKPLDIAIAAERVKVALAQQQQARVLWLPTVVIGADYFRQDGRIQDTAGNILDSSKSSFMLGAGPTTVFAVTEAIFAPLAARQVAKAREASLQAATNDSFEAVAEAYFNVQQARGELAGAEDAARRAEDLVHRTEKLSPGLAPPVEVSRTRTEFSRRRQAIFAAYERWHTASADLARLLRLDPAALVDPLEPPLLQITLVPLAQSLDELIATALTNRPELAAQQALVQATLQRLRQEKLRPLLPSVLLRGAATNPAGTLSGGVFGGGINSFVGDFSARNSIDVQLLWELRNLGFGNRVLVNERKADHQLSTLELFRIQDRVAAEVAQAHAQVLSAAARATEAEQGLRDALDSTEKNFEGLSQPRRIGNVFILTIRPQEAGAAVQALAQAYNDYYGAINDFNRAQFRLYRALGQPAHLLIGPATGCAEQAVPAPGDIPEAPSAAGDRNH